MSKRVVLIVALLSCLSGMLVSCQAGPTTPNRAPVAPDWKVSLLEDSVGAVVDLDGQQAVYVRGYGLVIGLAGTGSRECPEYILEVIRDGLRGQTRPDGTDIYADIDLREMVSSTTTAVVTVSGLIPPAAVAGDKIDLEVSALPGTQTTSLSGGELLASELTIEIISSSGKPIRKSPMVLAGHPEPSPIFVDPFAGDASSDQSALLRSGRIIGGGRVLQTRPLNLVLRIPGGSYRMARQVEQRLNFRFPSLSNEPPTAVAQDRRTIRLSIPSQYHGQERHFLMMVMGTYLPADPIYIEQRSKELIAELGNPSSNAERITAALESIGKLTIPALRRAYMSSDQRAVFYTARTAALLGDVEAISVLARFASDNSSEYQLSAAAALAELPNRYYGSQALRPLLDSENTLVRIRAYEALARNGDPSVKQVSFESPGPFALDVVQSTGQPLIYVQTIKQPRIVLFGESIRSRVPLFYLSADKLLTITSNQAAEDDAEQISIQRCTPSGSIGLTLKSSPDMVAIIKTMGSAIEPDHKGVHHGLGMDYSQLVRALHGLWQSKAVDAGFVLQPAPGVRNLLEQPHGSTG